MFMSDLLSEQLITQPPSSLSDLIELYNSTLSSLLDKHAPLITKPISSRHLILGSLHTYMNSKPHDVAWKSMETIERLHAMRLRLITNLYHHSIIKAEKVYHASLTLYCMNYECVVNKLKLAGIT